MLALYGAEFDSALRLSSAWSLRAAFGWTDARYRQFLYTPAPGQPAVDEFAHPFYLTPRLNAGVGVGYEAPLAGGALRVHADCDWQDSEQSSVFNDFNNQGAYGTLNARAAYSVERTGSWQIALFGTNLTGREFAVAGGSVVVVGSPQPATSWQVPGAPRLHGVKFSYRFGPKS